MHNSFINKRRISRKVYVGSVPVGGDAPIAVQSMTNTDTMDVAATVAQIKSLERAGADSRISRDLLHSFESLIAHHNHACSELTASSISLVTSM